LDNSPVNDHAAHISLPEAGGFRSQARPILFLVGIFFLNFLSRIILSPLMPTIETDLDISHGEAGSFFFFISLGYCIALLGSGLISSRLTHKKTVILSSMAVGVALIGTSLTTKMWGLRLGMFVLGMGSGVYLPSGIAILTSLVSPRHWGKAIAFHELAPNLGFVVAPVASEALLLVFSWRLVLLFIGAASILVGAAFAHWGHGGEFPGQPLSVRSSLPLVTERSFWIMMALFSFGISSFLGVYTMLPLYLVTAHGLDQNQANILISLSRISGLGVVFLAGWVTDRLGPKRVMRGIFLLIGLATFLLGLTSGIWLTIAVFFQAMLAVCFPPSALVALSRIGPARSRNLAVSLTIPFALLMGGGAIPTGIGFMADAGFFGLGMALLGGLICTGALLPQYLRFPGESGEADA
jgi:NNP family nitrate/nitrite transporter-like MFS transporter